MKSLDHSSKQDRINNTHDQANITISKLWNLELLKDNNYLKEYQDKVKLEVRKFNPEELATVESWRLLVKSMREAANQVIRKPSPLTPRRRKSLAQLNQAIYNRRRNIIDSSVVAAKRQLYNQQCQRARREECSEFFSTLGNYKPQERINKTHQFIKQYRRLTSRNNSAYLSLSLWERELSYLQDAPVALIEETDHWPVEEAPQMEDIKDIVKGIRVGTAPGLDQIPIQLINCLPEEGWELLVKIIQGIWVTNDIPEEWMETVQIPIKKIPNPKTVSDFRRITITDIGYRIYAKLLLTKLNKYTERIGSYQAAFLRNRSTDDHMFVVRRIMEEEWRTGKTLYVLSLDIKKAFDSVKLKPITAMLKFGKIPHYLINRIVKTCLWEKTSIMWCQQRTRTFEKTRGMKQGCPLSPYLFNIVLDNVLQTLVEIYPYVKLNQQEKIQLPLLLAYADDIIILHTDRWQMRELLNLLESVGLEINGSKSELLIRSPGSDDIIPQTVNVGGLNIPVKKSIKYLGTHLTNELNRKEIVKVRCGKALGVSRVLSSFIRKNKITGDVVIKMYKSIIAPLLTYGLKAAALTKANRTKLKRYERRIIVEMLKFSVARPPCKSARKNLSGRTISRRVTVYRLCYWGHVRRRNQGHVLNSVMKYTHKSKKIGRPCFTWNTSLDRDFNKFNIPKEEWEILSKDKKRLKEKAETLYDLEESSSGGTSAGEWTGDDEN